MYFLMAHQWRKQEEAPVAERPIPRYPPAMPILKNNRRENFCHGVAKGQSATQAYREAGYSGHGHVGEAGASSLVGQHAVPAPIVAEPIDHVGDGWRSGRAEG
ncbi:hypothetical protein BQ8482_410002 [Mesorhizobium delmotii]|uniref:Uncharacterized protein n=1 Tax=Mesorhizobium delmotii TaxID=1631247 RepID=A0A2P9AT62_9HYPH|nr:hypothetical protein BQ8482_410002 [Mesorhizobium delmotii]